MYEEQVDQLMQENCQLIEENKQLSVKNEKLTHLVKEAHLYTRVDSLEGNVGSIYRDISFINSSMAVIRVFNDLRDDVNDGRMNTNEAWRCLESAATSHKAEAPTGTLATPQVICVQKSVKAT